MREREEGWNEEEGHCHRCAAVVLSAAMTRMVEATLPLNVVKEALLVFEACCARAPDRIDRQESKSDGRVWKDIMIDRAHQRMMKKNEGRWVGEEGQRENVTEVEGYSGGWKTTCQEIYIIKIKEISWGYASMHASPWGMVLQQDTRIV